MAKEQESMWTYCPRCMSQQYHTKGPDGTWWCEKHRGPNNLIGLGIASAIFGGVRKILVPPRKGDNDGTKK